MSGVTRSCEGVPDVGGEPVRMKKCSYTMFTHVTKGGHNRAGVVVVSAPLDPIKYTPMPGLEENVDTYRVALNMMACALREKESTRNMQASVLSVSHTFTASKVANVVVT